MRALDCSVPDVHDDIHFTARDDDDLFDQVKLHTSEYHPQMTDDDIRQMITVDAYEE